VSTSRAQLSAQFSSELTLLGTLRTHVDDVLRPYADAKDYLYTSRVKGVASMLQKLETGRWSSAELDDALGATLVVATLGDVKACIDNLPKRVVIDPALSKRTADHSKDPDVFRFDDERLVCRLTAPAGAATQGERVWTRPFELQVKTIQQFAWGKITHPLVYKGDRFDWRMSRLAAQLRALAEQADLLYAEFKTIGAKIDRRSSRKGNVLDQLGRDLEAWLKVGLVPDDAIPPSPVRLVESLDALCRGLGLEPDKVMPEVQSELQSRGFDRSLSIYQFVLGVAVDRHSAEPLWDRARNRKVRLLVTSELEDRFPAAKSIPEDVRVGL